MFTLAGTHECHRLRAGRSIVQQRRGMGEEERRQASVLVRAACLAAVGAVGSGHISGGPAEGIGDGWVCALR